MFCVGFFAKMFLREYKKILGFLFLSGLMIWFFVGAAEYFEKRSSLSEFFEIAIVVEDEHRYLDILVNMLLSRKDFEEVFSFDKKNLAEAEKLYDSGEISSYIIVPEGFTESVMRGSNQDIIFVGNEDKPVQYNITKILLKSGIAFLTSSQSGIYATLDYAEKNGIDKDSIVMDINLEFGKELLAYKNYFESEVLKVTGSYPVRKFYTYSFAVFFFLLCGLNFCAPVGEILLVSDRLRLGGFTAVKISAAIYAAVFLVFLVPGLFLFGVFGFKAFFLALIVTALVVFSAVYFEGYSEFFILFISLLALFISGGIIPKGLLPEFVNNLSFLSPNHYIAGNADGIFVYTFIFFGLLFLLSYKKIKGVVLR